MRDLRDRRDIVSLMIKGGFDRIASASSAVAPHGALADKASQNPAYSGNNDKMSE
jgi:hypothetical protein